MYSHLADMEIWELVKSGQDDAAFGEIYSRFAATLYAVAYNVVRDVQTSEDIVQEVFISLWKNRERSEIKTVKAYLATAVTYLSINHLRAAGKIKWMDLSSMPEDGVDPSGQQNDQTEILLALLKDEADRLPDQCRLIFQYRRDEGLSVKEIAKKLDLSPRTVENQLYRAISRLRKSLKIISLVFLTRL